MQAFAALLDKLYFTTSNKAKALFLQEYLRATPDPDRGFAVAALAGDLSFDLFKRHVITDLIRARVDPVLYDLSRDYVGETSETVAHLWPVSQPVTLLNRLPLLHEVIARFQAEDKQGIRDYLVLLLDNMTPEQRWALLKLGTRGLRVGVSARFIKNVLAEYGNVGVDEVESVWHGVKPPYEPLFDWLEKRSPRPDVSGSITYHPVMLSHPLEDRELALLSPEEFSAEWKYDGIRVQIVSSPKGAALFSRTGDDISHSFPDLVEQFTFNAVLDGELLVRKEGMIASFNDLQQRLGRKAPTRKLMETYPAHLVLYDALELEGIDQRPLPFTERRTHLQEWFEAFNPDFMEISPLLGWQSGDDLLAMRNTANREQDNFIEGLMLKRKDSPYLSGRPKGHWYKWKRDPLMVDAVLMYAQRGSGKRSSFYSDYTFGLWKGEELLPIGKAYSGFTDAELKQLDNWIRAHTTNRFGPVREVERGIVFEVAFDAVNTSARHKSGFALRFPRINRIRWDKPVADADQMENLEKMLT